MASITKRGETYFIRVSNGYDSNNKRIFATMTYKPKAKKDSAIEKEVQAAAVQFENDVHNGNYYSGENYTFEKFAEVWREKWADKHLTQNVKEGYIKLIDKWALPVIGNKKLTKITAFDIQDIIDNMETAGLAPATVHRVISAINSVFRYAYRMNLIRENVIDRVELPKLERDGDLHYFTLEQSKRFLAALEKRYPFEYSACIHSYDADGGARYRAKYEAYHTIPVQYQAYFYLAIYGGFRRGELIALTWNDIDFQNRMISITKAAAITKEEGQVIKTPKTKAGNRTIQLPKDCFRVLHAWKAEQMQLSLTLGDNWQGSRGADYDNNFVFIDLKTGRMMDLSTPYHKFHEIIEMYNRTCEKEEDKLPLIRLHDLRHTSATLLLSENVDIETVSHRLGHSKPSITLDVYGHALETKDEKASNTLEALFG